MSPRVAPRPTGARYRVVVTEISDHDGDLTLRQRLVVSITDATHRPKPPNANSIRLVLSDHLLSQRSA